MYRGKNLDLNAYQITELRRTKTMKEIAEILNVKLNSLYEWCRRNNVITKRATDFEILEEYKRTGNVKETASNLGISIYTVYQNLPLKYKKSYSKRYTRIK